MKKQRLFLPVLLVLLFSLTIVAVANSAYLRLDSSGFYNHDYNEGVSYRWDITEGGGVFDHYFDLSPTKAGLFSQQVNLTTSFGASGNYAAAEEYAPFPSGSYESSTSVRGAASVIYEIWLDQSGPLHFTSLSWEAKLLNDDGSTTTLFTMSAAADLISSGGKETRETGFDFPYVTIPVLQQESFDFFTYIDQRYGWHDWSYTSILDERAYKTVTLSVTGYVIDTTAVPIPSALLLVGSGLIRLAISGRRKLVCRS